MNYGTSEDGTSWDSAACIVPYSSDTVMSSFIYEAFDFATSSPLVSLDSTNSFETAYITTPRLDTAQGRTNNWTIDPSQSINECFEYYC